MRTVMALALALTACGASSSMIGPNTYEISCRRSRSSCWREAQRVCPQGFQQLDGDSQTGYVVMGGNMVAPAYKGEMLVKCTSGR